MADQTLQGINAFGALQSQSRKNAAYAALRKQYGDTAGDPAAAAELQKIDESTQAFPLQQQARQQAIATSKQSMETNAATEAEKQRVTRGNELLSGALFIQNARKRDPNVDVGALFDRIAPTLNLSPQDAQAARATLTADPGAADDLVTAFRLKQGAEKGDPAAVQEYNYYAKLNPEEQANYLKVKRSSFNAVRDVGGVPTAIQVAPGAAAPTQTALSTLPAETAAAQTLAGGKAAGAAVGKVEGEKTASDLPLSATERARVNSQFETSKATLNDSLGDIDAAIKEIGPFSTGIGSLTRFIPGSPGANLQARLVPIAGRTLLNQVSQMKELSKNGSTGLGALSDTEGRYLTGLQGSLDAAQSPKQLVGTLRDIKRRMQESWSRFEKAYHDDLDARGSAPKAAPAVQGSRVEGNNVILKWNPAKGDFE